LEEIKMSQHTYGFCYVPSRGYWVGGWGNNAEFTPQIEGAGMFYLDSPSLEKAIKDFNGNLQEMSFNKPMQAIAG
jgi:hypothetical protein